MLSAEFYGIEDLHVCSVLTSLLYFFTRKIQSNVACLISPTRTALLNLLVSTVCLLNSALQPALNIFHMVIILSWAKGSIRFLGIFHDFVLGLNRNFKSLRNFRKGKMQMCQVHAS